MRWATKILLCALLSSTVYADLPDDVEVVTSVSVRVSTSEDHVPKAPSDKKAPKTVLPKLPAATKRQPESTTRIVEATTTTTTTTTTTRAPSTTVRSRVHQKVLDTTTATPAIASTVPDIAATPSTIKPSTEPPREPTRRKRKRPAGYRRQEGIRRKIQDESTTASRKIPDLSSTEMPLKSDQMSTTPVTPISAPLTTDPPAALPAFNAKLHRNVEKHPGFFNQQEQPKQRPLRPVVPRREESFPSLPQFPVPFEPSRTNIPIKPRKHHRKPEESLNVPITRPQQEFRYTQVTYPPTTTPEVVKPKSKTSLLSYFSFGSRDKKEERKEQTLPSVQQPSTAPPRRFQENTESVTLRETTAQAHFTQTESPPTQSFVHEPILYRQPPSPNGGIKREYPTQQKHFKNSKKYRLAQSKSKHNVQVDELPFQAADIIPQNDRIHREQPHQYHQMHPNTVYPVPAVEVSTTSVFTTSAPLASPVTENPLVVETRKPNHHYHQPNYTPFPPPPPSYEQSETLQHPAQFGTASQAQFIPPQHYAKTRHSQPSQQSEQRVPSVEYQSQNNYPQQTYGESQQPSSTLQQQFEQQPPLQGSNDELRQNDDQQLRNFDGRHQQTNVVDIQQQQRPVPQALMVQVPESVHLDRHQIKFPGEFMRALGVKNIQPGVEIASKNVDYQSNPQLVGQLSNGKGVVVLDEKSNRPYIRVNSENRPVHPAQGYPIPVDVAKTPFTKGIPHGFPAPSKVQVDDRTQVSLTGVILPHQGGLKTSYNELPPTQVNLNEPLNVHIPINQLPPRPAVNVRIRGPNGIVSEVLVPLRENKGKHTNFHESGVERFLVPQKQPSKYEHEEFYLSKPSEIRPIRVPHSNHGPQTSTYHVQLTSQRIPQEPLRGSASTQHTSWIGGWGNGIRSVGSRLGSILNRKSASSS